MQKVLESNQLFNQKTLDIFELGKSCDLFVSR